MAIKEIKKQKKDIKEKEEEEQDLEEFVEEQISNPEILNPEEMLLQSGQSLEQIKLPGENLEQSVGEEEGEDAEEEQNVNYDSQNYVEGLYDERASQEEDDERTVQIGRLIHASEIEVGRRPQIEHAAEFRRDIGLIPVVPDTRNDSDDKLYEVGTLKQEREEQETPLDLGDERLKKYKPKR
jgi:hypothetical protein